MTDQVAKAARKQLAELAVSRPKGFGGTYGFYAITEEARVIDRGWKASMVALREGWQDMLDGTSLVDLLPAATIMAGRTEMRGRYFTGCWEVTAEMPLTPEQREELYGALEAGGYALVCPGEWGGGLGQKGRRWAVPPSRQPSRIRGEQTAATRSARGGRSFDRHDGPRAQVFATN